MPSGRPALRAPLALILATQAALLLARPGLLPPWGDEYSSLMRAALPAGEMLEALRHNVHPPLYAALLQGWLALPWDAPALQRARVLSALLLLAATVVLDRTWLRDVDARTRGWFLVLWAASPALLLYGRMARSYSLQLLLAPPALWLGWRAVREPTTRHAFAYGVVLTLLLYAHYLPGLAVLGGVAGSALWRWWATGDRRVLRALLLPLAIVAVGYAPWLPALSGALGRVGHGAPYSPLGHRWLDAGLSLAYALVSFSLGEALWPWMPLALPLLAVGLAVLLWRGLRAPPAWLGLILPAAVIAFAGAGQWVSYAFVAARLLFLLPFYLLLLLHGGRDAPRLRNAVGGLWLALSLGGIAAYFAGAGFLNQAYVIPAAAIAQTIAPPDSDAAPLIVLDHHNVNLTPLQLYLPATAQVRLLEVASDAEAAAALAIPPRGGLWFAHAAHDTSPEGWNARIEAAWSRRCPLVRHQFAPFSAFDRQVMRIAGWPAQPTHAVELVELRCPAAAVAVSPAP
ncbi:MAG: hypothetical protein ABI629_10360 [bacterium]